jgi:hypothetical protein
VPVDRAAGPVVALGPEARERERALALLHLDHHRRMNHDFAGARGAVDEARAIAAELGDEDLATEAA